MFNPITDCINHSLVGDKYCHDETSNLECGFDHGDCCGSCINTKYCSECECLGGFYANSIRNALVGDGFCNDETNNPECNYDGGDCCLFSPNTDQCSQCVCYTSGAITSPGYPQNYDNNLDLSWLIVVPIGQTIEINFINFETESW